MKNTTTISQALVLAAHRLRAISTTPRLDAELLLGHVLAWNRAQLLAAGRQLLSAEQQAAFEVLLQRRTSLEPVAYLIGHKEFYGYDLNIDARVLVPRPETELLVDLALELARHPPLSQRPMLSIADIGTGSGAIALALALQLPTAQVLAVDLLPTALAVARSNVERYALTERVQLLEGDLCVPLQAPVDLLVSNPPYTILSEIETGVRLHEPHAALDGGPDGLAVYRRLLATIPAYLQPSGAALIEIGATQGAAVMKLARQAFPDAHIALHTDLAGLDRVVVIDTNNPVFQAAEPQTAPV